MRSEPSPGTQSRPVRLVIADDHYLVRGGFRDLLDSEPDLVVVGEAENGREALELCRRLRPDLVLMDVRMPEMDGLEATRAINEEWPEIAVLMVTAHENPEYLFEALKAGAAGYVLKEAPKHELLDAIRRVLNGEFPLNQELTARLIQRLVGGAKQEARSSPGESRKPSPKPLTARELEVLRLLARGKTNPEIAQDLVISRGTAKIHVQNIIAKLGVSDRTQAVVRAIDLGLVAPESGKP